jgi:hypothetical protein
VETTRTITLKPWKVGPYSRAMTVPGWWLRLNNFPDELEVTFAMGEIIVRPKAKRDGQGTGNATGPAKSEEDDSK